jgi:outer membrane protein, heavy metal efflux system
LGTTVSTVGALRLLSGILCLFASVPVWAATPGLGLTQVIEFALLNNGELRAFRSEKGIRDAGSVRAGLLPNPTLELEAGTGALTGSGAENSLSLGVSQEFLLPGKRAKRVAVAAREQDIYRWQLADRERILREEVKSAFYEVILAEKRVALADRSIALNRQLLGVARERLDAGDIPELELNLVKVELARSEAARIEAGKLSLQIQGRLLTLMGRSRSECPTFAGDFDPELSPGRELADLVQQALGNRPDLKALEAEKGRGEAEMVLARAETIPNLTAGLSLQRESTAIEVGGAEGRDTAYLVGFKLSMPIPVFDRNQAGLQEARARHDSAASHLSAAAATIEREVETAYASLKQTEKILGLYRSSINPQLEENLKLTEEAYRLGEVGILAVIQEQKKFYEVSESYLAALQDRQAALVKLQSAAAIDFTGGVQ